MRAEKGRLQSILKRLGLTEKEAEVYVAIATRGSATAKDLLNTLERIHQPQLYNIISSLVRKGFVRVSMGRPKVYAANDLEAIFEVRKKVLESLKREALSLLSTIRSLEKDMGEEKSQVFLVRGREGLEATVLEVLSSSKVEVCAELPTEMALKVADTVEALLQRGVNVYMIVFPEVPKGLAARLAKYSNIALKRDKLGNFLFVSADFKVAVYARRRFFGPRKRPVPESEVYGFFISERDLIWRLISTFENTWRKTSEPVIYRPPSPDAYPKVFIEYGILLDELEELLRRGYRPYVHVEGLSVGTREPVILEGYVVRVNKTDHISNFTLVADGEELTVGGFDAEVEDIEAFKVIIERAGKARARSRSSLA